jgi:hypothetical protein
MPVPCSPVAFIHACPHVAVCPQVPAGVTGLGPLQRLHTQLACCLQLTTHLHSQLSGGIAGQAIKLEMQVWQQQQPSAALSLAM